MDAALLPVALGSTLAWAVFDAVRKGLVAEVPVQALSFWVSVAQLPGYCLWLAIAGGGAPEAGYFAPALGSVAVNLLSNLLFLEAVRLAPLSTVVPLLALTPVFVALGSIPLLGEHLGAVPWLGVVLVALGAYRLVAPPAALAEDLDRSRDRRRGVLFMVVVAALWALSPMLDKLALRHAAVGTHGLVLASGVALGMLPVLAARGALPSLALAPRVLPLLALGGAVNVLALGLQMIAVTAMVVSVFEAFKRAAGLLLALLFGALFFRERLGARQLLAGVTMAAGVVLVLLAR
jgi:drug/metabolite transporter (DMT)-like permease